MHVSGFIGIDSSTVCVFQKNKDSKCNNLAPPLK